MKIRKILALALSLAVIGSPLAAKKHKADYIVIGMGTSGAVIAKMLTDDKKTSVIGIHKGENLSDDPLIKYSAGALFTVPSALFDSPLFDSGLTTPQPNANNRQLRWVECTAAGGDSAINAGVYVRGTNQVYSQWESLAGPNWSLDRILATFKGLETYKGKTPNPIFRGFKGPVNVRQDPNPSQISKVFTQALGTATGTPSVLDFNDPLTPIGNSAQLQYTQKGPHGELRVSSASAFLNRKVMTPNGRGVNCRKLRVYFESTALRTLWKGNKAIGVEYVKNGKTKQVFARKGVIVSAGLQSSAFLMHSGVGDQAVLQALNIPVVFNNPNVGQGLVDHPMVQLVFTTDPDDFQLDQAGLFTNISFLPTPGGDPTQRTIRFSTINKIPGFALGILDLLQPQSRGSITINSADPLSELVMDYGAFTSSADLALYVQAFQTYMLNLNTALQQINPDYTLVIPDVDVISNTTLLTDFIKEGLISNQSFQSHCKMAPLNQGGVVDGTGHVYGVENLIVADDSIIPHTMDGAPMASAFLIGFNIARILQGK